MDFNFDLDDVRDVVKVLASDVLNLFSDSVLEISSSVIEFIDDKNVISKRNITKEDFLINKGETLMEKYGAILEKVVSLTEK